VDEPVFVCQDVASVFVCALVLVLEIELFDSSLDQDSLELFQSSLKIVALKFSRASLVLALSNFSLNSSN
jgi:hypothetical protein